MLGVVVLVGSCPVSVPGVIVPGVVVLGVVV